MWRILHARSSRGRSSSSTGSWPTRARSPASATARPGKPLLRLALPILQALSARELARRRAEIVDAVRAVAPLRFVNGGGTGSIERTAAEPAVTEVAAGSGLFGPTLFDTYRAFKPAPGGAVRAAGGAQAVGEARHRAGRRLPGLRRRRARPAAAPVPARAA